MNTIPFNFYYGELTEKVRNETVNSRVLRKSTTFGDAQGTVVGWRQSRSVKDGNRKFVWKALVELDKTYWRDGRLQKCSPEKTDFLEVILDVNGKPLFSKAQVSNA